MSSMVIERLEKYRIIPALSFASADDIVPICDALGKGGLKVAEITFRTAAAQEAIKIAAEKFPDFLIGAGTVTSTEQLDAAITAGAKFAVAPGLNAKVVKRAEEANLPFFPGIMTPSEIGAALDLGCRILKYFPAEPTGGIRTLKAIYAPYSHLGVRLIPTGGIDANNMMDYLSFRGVLAIGGSWLACSSLIAERNWKRITELTQEALAKIA